MQVSSLPAEAKSLLQPAQAASPQAYMRLSSMPPGVEAACWRRFHAALEPLYQARLGAARTGRDAVAPVTTAPLHSPPGRARLCRRSPRLCAKRARGPSLPAWECPLALQAAKLGLVIFQFHLSFLPSQQNLQVLWSAAVGVGLQGVVWTWAASSALAPH